MSSYCHHVHTPILNSNCYSTVGVSTIYRNCFPVVVVGNRRCGKRKVLKVVKAVAATSTGRKAVSKPSTSSSALEQLDIERGVCIPFRKYTPETVSLYI